ncbi:MAG: class I SAM-dependent methyltransferase [Longimicrobiales bacterium]
MMRRLRRHDGVEVEVRITRDDFIRPPRDSQRSWLVNRTMTELTEELRYLDRAARGFVAGREHAGVPDRATAPLRDEEIMEDWQVPIMQVMAALVAAAHGDVLEVGFGRGVSASFLQDAGVRSHTIVECNPSVIDRFHQWRAALPAERDVRLITGRWQDTTDRLAQYDGVFFHTYPLDDDEYADAVVRGVTFAADFFPVAARHLRPGGVFTYLTNEADSVSRAHQRLLLEHFREFRMQIVSPLALPDNSADDLWADSMVVIGAIR